MIYFMVSQVQNEARWKTNQLSELYPFQFEANYLLSTREIIHERMIVHVCDHVYFEFYGKKLVPIITGFHIHFHGNLVQKSILIISQIWRWIRVKIQAEVDKNYKNSNWTNHNRLKKEWQQLQNVMN